MKTDFNHHLQKGFTLIELIIVMSLMILTGVLIVAILNSTLKGAGKTRSTNDLAQNGNYALSIISNLLVNSQKLLTFTDTNGVVYNDCTTGPINGKELQILNFDNGTSKIICSEGTLDISSASASFSNTVPVPTAYANNSLLNTSQIKLVPNTCLFTCSQQDIFAPPRIDITFQLQKAIPIAGEQNPSIRFNTSVTLRNQVLR